VITVRLFGMLEPRDGTVIARLDLAARGEAEVVTSL
jgi:hypothetical protein